MAYLLWVITIGRNIYMREQGNEVELSFPAWTRKLDLMLLGKGKGKELGKFLFFLCNLWNKYLEGEEEREGQPAQTHAVLTEIGESNTP